MEENNPNATHERSFQPAVQHYDRISEDVGMNKSRQNELSYHLYRRFFRLAVHTRSTQFDGIQIPSVYHCHEYKTLNIGSQLMSTLELG